MIKSPPLPHKKLNADKSILIRLTLSCLFFTCLAPSEAANLYLSPKGNDASDGSKASPFATLAQTANAVLAARKISQDDPVTVWVSGGEYLVTEPCVLSKEDSGTEKAPVIYRAVEGEKPILINARPLLASDFHLVTDSTTLARFADSVKGKVFEISLKALGIPFLPVPPATFSDSGGLPALYCDGKRMELSRYPKKGFMTMKSVLHNGSPHNDPGIFEYREENYPNFEKWKKVENRGIILKGYWRVMWQNEAIRIKTIDPFAHTVAFESGVGGGIGSKYHRPAGDGREQYWLFNMPEEITAPGEWAIDYQDQKIYFYPPSALEKSKIYLGLSTKSVIQMMDASHVIIRGLTFEYGLGSAIEINGGDHDLVAGCTVCNVGAYAIKIAGGRNHMVLSCDLYHLGEGGVWLSGGDDKVTRHKPASHQVINNHIYDFSEIVKVYTPAVNCGYAGGISHYPCVGCLVAHNLIHDTPHAGVCFGSWDNVFEYNEVFRYCLVSNDMGAFYAFSRFMDMGNDTFRYNLMHDSGQGDGLYFDYDHKDMHVYGNIAYLKSGGTAYLYKVGTQLDRKFMNDPASVQPLDCHDNIVMSCNQGFTLWIPEAPPSTIANNVAVNCSTAWSCTELSNGKGVKMSLETIAATNKAYAENPGFIDPDHLNFNLRPNAQLLKDIPSFKLTAVEKIGLYIDEYRKSLPNNEEIDRYCTNTSIGGKSYKIEDRK